MKARTKFLLGGVVVLGTAGYLMATSIRSTGEYYLTPTEFETKLVADPSFRDVGVKVGARVVPGTIQRFPGGRDYAFTVTDGAKTIPVVYHGLAPDTFTDGVDVVVEGRMGQDGTFRATTLLAKCASRYENAPDKYRNTPGYKAAAAGA
ncbi:MAG TPA: cytochrome c maturation protein CcmE [Gemmatimonadaceae bacterium]|jgi:cytochrome c-type biogenesis protein CcmE|nr:cytochrome c maturation protein CcmE [Gemmatimonadaceae bacterium]